MDAVSEEALRERMGWLSDQMYSVSPDGVVEVVAVDSFSYEIEEYGG